MKIIGLIINPIAGMGGRVGLKGTDGIEILNKAIQLGASMEAPNIALGALRKLEPLKGELLILTAPGDMGENQCKALEFRYEVVHQITDRGGADRYGRSPGTGNSGFAGISCAAEAAFCDTDSTDTVRAAAAMADRAELILFAGGDGTARDICRAVGTRAAVLGIPAGVKIYSPVYGNTSQAAGELAFLYLKHGSLPLKEEEVVDLDEEAVRGNVVRTELYGYLKVPYQREYLQNKKAPSPLSEEESRRAIALDVIDHMREGESYLIGPGTTAGAVMEALSLPNTLLGVDVIRDGKVVKLDCNERDLLDILDRTDPGIPGIPGMTGIPGILDASEGRSAKLVIAPTGGQGYLLGRGNQQISPEVLRKIGKENIIILSVNSKIVDLQGRPLLIDTGDGEINRSLEGYYRIKVGYGSDIIYKVSGMDI